MRVIKNPFGNKNAKATITGVFEILIPDELWQKIELAHTKHFKLTYSWVTRYSLGRMLSRKTFWNRAKFLSLKRRDKNFSKARESSHRHTICLYEEDQQLLKSLSAELQVDISLLVRIAVMWYLEEFDVDEIPTFAKAKSERRKFGKISFEKIKAFGTKFGKKVEVVRYRESPTSLVTVSQAILCDESDFW